MPMITIKDLTFGYDGSENNLFEDVNVTLDTSWKLALAGRNGRGKTTFFKLLRGELQYAGSITGVPPTVCFPMEEFPDNEEWRVRKARRSSQPRDRTQVSHIIGRCFTI